MSERAPYALVVGDGSAGACPGDVVVVFGTPAEADRFARRHGLTDWTVAPVRLATTLDEIRRDLLAPTRIRPRTS